MYRYPAKRSITSSTKWGAYKRRKLKTINHKELKGITRRAQRID